MKTGYYTKVISLCFLGCIATPVYSEVTINMNSVSPEMTLIAKDTGEKVEVGEPDSRTYNFKVTPGGYILTAIARDGKTVNGSIEINIKDGNEIFDILTEGFYVTNKHYDGSSWTMENNDYTVMAEVCSREGDNRILTLGQSVNEGRYTFLALNGDSYYLDFIPSGQHQNEGFGTMHKFGTLTGNINIGATITKLIDYVITAPKDVELLIGEKRAHFTDFSIISPYSKELEGKTAKITYKLPTGLIYNYRLWKEGALTNAGYFNLSTEETRRPVLNFTEDDFSLQDPKEYNHDVESNNGFETGDIFLNVNEKGFLKLNIGETFLLHTMRSWQLTDNSTNNYFMEPDFHFTVLDLEGNVCEDVITISSRPGSPWHEIQATGQGSVIVLVNYDGMKLNYYNGAAPNAYMGGEYWGAIWPENTGVFVVNVGDGESAVNSEFIVNEEINRDALKLVGKFVDSEHDVFYYTENYNGYPLTFKAENVAKVEVAYPEIGDYGVSFNGFCENGVEKENENEYKVLLKEGRQIVKLTDYNGVSEFQVLTAKKCAYNIINLSSPENKGYKPGDEIGIQFSGLRHPANKLAGVYNMSAYICYNGIPNGSSLILSGNQYTFGSNKDAQFLKVVIPANFDITKNKSFDLTDGVIQVNGYGDPIGNHRNISKTVGRSPNFTAVPHKTYFGALPDVKIYFNGAPDFDIYVSCEEEDVEIFLSRGENLLSYIEPGHYKSGVGDYTLEVFKDGFEPFICLFSLSDTDDTICKIDVILKKIEGGNDNDGDDGATSGITFQSLNKKFSEEYMNFQGKYLSCPSQGLNLYKSKDGIWRKVIVR